MGNSLNSRLGNNANVDSVVGRWFGLGGRSDGLSPAGFPVGCV